MHVGGVAVLDAPPGGVNFDDLVKVLDRRLRSAPRYRQKLRWAPRMPGTLRTLGAPGWVDDADFDIGRHVRSVTLPAPGSRSQLYRLVADLQSSVLDRTRPLWELTVVEGLADGGFAVVTKAHHAMVDGVGAADITAVILESTANVDSRPAAQAAPAAEAAAAPAAVPDHPRLRGTSMPAAAVRATVGLAAAVRTTIRPAPRSTLNARIGSDRLIGVARTRLEDYRQVRRLCAGTVNDVVLAVVAGALRRWLLERGDRVPRRGVRALVPLSVRSGPAGELGNRLSTYFVDLPVADPDPLSRLRTVTAAMRRHKQRNQSAGATFAITLAGLAPAPVHALAARSVNTMSRLLFNVVVSNVPGPQHPLYLSGARVQEIVPVVPLPAGQSVSIGLLSYDGGMFYGLNADRATVPDIDRLAVAIEAELAVLVELARIAPPPQ